MRVEYQSTLDDGIAAHTIAARQFADASNYPVLIAFVVTISMMVLGFVTRGRIGDALVTLGAGALLGMIVFSLLVNVFYKARLRQMIIEGRGTAGEVSCVVEVDEQDVHSWTGDLYIRWRVTSIREVNDTDKFIEIKMKGGGLVLIRKDKISPPESALEFTEHVRRCGSLIEPPPLRG